RGVPTVDRGVVLHAGIAAAPGGVGNLEEQVLGLEGLHRAAVFHRASGEVGVTHHGVHEVVGHAHGVVGVLEENGAVSFGVGRTAVVTHRNQRVGLGFFFRL